MHESGLVEQLIREVEKIATSNGAGRVVRIELLGPEGDKLDEVSSES